MTKTRIQKFVVGARGSLLSVAQTQSALALLAHEVPETRYLLKTIETPGDRDLTTPLERSAPDFFTRDLDEAVRAGTIDFAIHSAKDLPNPMPTDLDWFWLPNREDARDCWVCRCGATVRKIGISSDRRRAFAQKTFPRARLLPIRGAIDARLKQVIDGTFDAVLMAVAGLKRLYPDGLPEGVVMAPIPRDELTPPEAQGVLAVVFKKGDARLMQLRERFVKAVRFVSAGVGSAELCTVAGVRDVSLADVVLYDDLQGFQFPTTGKGTRFIHVGKRCGAHSMKQDEITQLICDEARKGRRVVRLKGGDAGLFGRLAEETDALTALRIPFLVRPGVSALTAATTGTGLLLTRRGESRGFTVFTPRSTGTELPQVMFMATRVARVEARKLLAEGWARNTPCAFVWEAAGPREEVCQTTLSHLAAGRLSVHAEEERPGLLIVGKVAEHVWPKLGAFAGRRVLLTCSDALQERAAAKVEDRGGKPIHWPLIRLAARPFDHDCERYDAIVLTSPSAVRLFFDVCTCDRRRLPEFYTCGAGSDAELRKYGVSSDVMPASDFSAQGLIDEIRTLNLKGRHVLRLRSAKAGSAVAVALRRAGAVVDDVVLYDNEFCAPSPVLPPFEVVFFASASAVESFLAQYGAAPLRDVEIFVMGEPTRAALPARLRARAKVW